MTLLPSAEKKRPQIARPLYLLGVGWQRLPGVGKKGLLVVTWLHLLGAGWQRDATISSLVNDMCPPNGAHLIVGQKLHVLLYVCIGKYLTFTPIVSGMRC
jgi:hypothetical protein